MSTVQNTKETPKKGTQPTKVKFEKPKVRVVRSKTPHMSRTDYTQSAKRSSKSYRFLANQDILPGSIGKVYKERTLAIPKKSQLPGLYISNVELQNGQQFH